jgi:murein L,D-transpeptidase YcbB/YkuD
MTRKTGFLGVALVCLALCQSVAASADVSTYIRAWIERIRTGDCVEIDDCPISSTIVLPALYEKYNYRPIWTNPESVSQLLSEIEASSRDGLDPEDYHLASIRRLQSRLAQAAGPEVRAEFDLVLSDSLIRLGYHLLVGKVDPESLDGNWNMQRTLELDPLLALSGAIEDGDVTNLVAGFRPQAVFYHDLKQALADYRRLQAQGGWPVVPAGETLKPGMTDSRVVALRRRLVVTGDLDAMDTASHAFDENVEAAVRRFQQRHGLDDDGVIGRATLAELNVPVEARIDQLRVNLERARWVLHDLPRDFVLTDIAGFQVRYFRDGQPVWNTRSQVGTAYRKTPVFRDRIRYIEFNPTWTVPPTILRQDILPRVKRDPGYLEQKNLRVLDRDGKPVDAAGIDWSLYPARGFPYLLRQDPGPDNALGRMKFMFPNKHAVYLHDTPYQSKFSKTRRTFSSGCIRIEDPYGFAALLLDDKPEWTRARIDEVVDSRKTTRVNLSEPLTVLLLYWTSEVDAEGRVIFRQDIYDRDAGVLAALNSGFSFGDRTVVREP